MRPPEQVIFSRFQKNLVHPTQDQANRILTEHRDKLDRMAGALLEREVLGASQ